MRGTRCIRGRRSITVWAASVALALWLAVLPGLAHASEGSEAGTLPIPALEGGSSVGLSRSQGVLPRAGLCGIPGVKACWADGIIQSFSTPDCSDLTDINGLATAYTGYWIADDGGYPATGDRYWGHVVASYGVLACLAATSVEAVLPPGTEFALDPSLPENVGRIRCFLSYLGGSNPRTYEFTGEAGQNDSCLTQPGIGGFGNLLGYSTMTTTLDEYTMFEIVFPIRSTTPLLGIASSNDKLRSRVGFNFDPVFPEAWVLVQRSVVRVSGRKSGSRIVASGTLAPTSEVRSTNASGGAGPKVVLSFTGKKRGRTVNLGTRSLVPTASGSFSTQFSRRAGTRGCQVRASWAGVAKAARPVSC